ncbi:signal peptidase I [Enterococcus songbeiensis]|uniref:signal peptidase I n=1 Tax=Enterococcus songbeiensis TaxID=2559927 RepID=UPI0010F9ACC6|nr:signal peptidase I [Enterococcus songbeiensis]
MKQKVRPFFKRFIPVIGIILFVLYLRMFVFQPVKVMGHSMDPTLQTNERLLILKSQNIKRLDIVVVKHPTVKKKIIIKRVIGIPGDYISFKNDKMKINGKLVNESYLKEYLKLFKENKLQEVYTYSEQYQELARNSKNFTNQDFEIHVPENNYFLLGDNRLVSEDSRVFGNVESNQIIGKSIIRIWPVTKENL